MKSVYITRKGGPEVLEVRESRDPEPGKGEIRVRIRAIGVNFADIMMRMGLYPGAPNPPFVPGYEAAGVVDRVGAGVTDYKKGQSVVVPTELGGYSDTLIANACDVFPLPDGKSFLAGAALTVNYLTAYEALVHQGNLQKGQRVLIHAAAGGVGIAAIQIAKILQAEIYGTSSAPKHEYLKRLGVKHCIDYRKDNFETKVRELTKGEGVHLVLDAVGGGSFRRSYKSLTPTGKLIIYGFSAAVSGPTHGFFKPLWHYLNTPSFSPLDLMQENKGVIGIHLGKLSKQKELLASHLRTILGWWSQGKIEPIVGTTFPLEMASRAHEYIQDRRNVGKVILTVE